MAEHAAQSIGEYVRALGTANEKIAALETAATADAEALAAARAEAAAKTQAPFQPPFPSVSSRDADADDAAKERAVALAEIATASVKAELKEARAHIVALQAAAEARSSENRTPDATGPDGSPARIPNHADATTVDGATPTTTTPPELKAAREELDRARAQLHDALGESRAAREALAASERRAKVAEGAAKSAAERIRAEAESRVRAAEVAAEMRVAAAREEAAEAAETARLAREIVELERDRAERTRIVRPSRRDGDVLESWAERADEAEAANERLRVALDAARVTETAGYGVAFAAMASATTATERGDLLAATCAATAHALEFATRVVRDGNRTGGWMAAAETLRAPTEPLVVLEHLAANAAATRWTEGVSGEGVDEFEGGRLEGRVCAATRDIVGCLREAAEAAAGVYARVHEATGANAKQSSGTNAKRVSGANAKQVSWTSPGSGGEAFPSAFPSPPTETTDGLAAFLRDAATPGTYFANGANTTPGTAATGAYATPGSAGSGGGKLDWASVERATSPAVQRLNAIEASLAARRIAMFESMMNGVAG